MAQVTVHIGQGERRRMILEFLYSVFVGFITFVFTLFPNIPPPPDGITSPLNYILDLTGDGLNLVRFLFGAVVYYAVVFMFAALLAFEPIYHLVMYIYHKVTSLF